MGYTSSIRIHDPIDIFTYKGNQTPICTLSEKIQFLDLRREVLPLGIKHSLLKTIMFL